MTATATPAAGLGTWHGLPAAQQPDWPDEEALKRAEAQLAGLPPLVIASETRQLTSQLAQVAQGRAFLLQAGDCAESFTEFNADKIGVLTPTLVLVATAQPPAVAPGAPFGLTVAVHYASGLPDTAFDGDVSLALASGTGGATLGGLLGWVWLTIEPGAPVGSYALIGATAFLAATSQGPLSSIVMMLEMTRTADGLMVPMVLSTMVAAWLVRRCGIKSMYAA